MSRDFTKKRDSWEIESVGAVPVVLVLAGGEVFLSLDPFAVRDCLYAVSSRMSHGINFTPEW